MKTLLIAFASTLTLVGTASAGPQVIVDYRADCECQAKQSEDASLCKGTGSVVFDVGASLPPDRLEKKARSECRAPRVLPDCPARKCRRALLRFEKLGERGGDRTKSETKDPAEVFLGRMESQEQLTKSDVCEAYQKLTLKKKRRRLPPCKRSKESGIKSVVGKAKDCRTHYTLYTSGNQTICQCNQGAKHSELIALANGARRMANVAFPCKTKCYAALIKHLHENPNETLHVSYSTVRADAADSIHAGLADACAGR